MQNLNNFINVFKKLDTSLVELKYLFVFFSKYSILDTLIHLSDAVTQMSYKKRSVEDIYHLSKLVECIAFILKNFDNSKEIKNDLAHLFHSLDVKIISSLVEANNLDPDHGNTCYKDFFNDFQILTLICSQAGEGNIELAEQLKNSFFNQASIQ